jgi:hypothetical protein
VGNDANRSRCAHRRAEAPPAPPVERRARDVLRARP